MKSPYLLFIMLCCFLLIGCSQEKPITQAEFGISGIDVSLHQGDIDFVKVRADAIGYVFIRSTDGITYQDQSFKTNYNNAKAAGLYVGAYHFYRNEDDPHKQLDNFIKNTELENGDLAPVVDIEKFHQADERGFEKDLQTFLDGLEKHYRLKPIIYSGTNFANQYLANFSNYPLWLADYNPGPPEIPGKWNTWAFWQWSESGRVSGITAVVDMSRFNHKDYEFQDLLINHK